LWRELRLAALADAPDAFGSSLAIEQAFDEAAWRDRLVAGLWAAAFTGTAPAGIVGARHPVESSASVELISMWVRAEARGGGTAQVLVREVLSWAQEQGNTTVELFVTENNDRARRLYERLGFDDTGDYEPLASNPALRCQRMVRLIGPARTTA
jgi:ribosomal protein S18 acetylase RimI-like enzyme